MLRSLLSLVLASCLIIGIVEAKPENKKKGARIIKAPPLQTSLVVDVDTGKILHTEDAHKRVYPASLTKLMTLYLVFDAVKKGKCTMDTSIQVSAKAAKMPPTKLGLYTGEKIKISEAIDGIIVKSANDASVAVAEMLAGSEEDFVRMMNAKAKQLGMRNTNFTNSSGWHHAKQETTAVDMVKLSLALRRDFSEYYSLFNKNSFVYKGRVVQGHNRVVANYNGAEGLKTGYHSHSGFNLVTTAARNNKRLVAVVTGGESAAKRDQKMVRLLNHHFGVKEIAAAPVVKQKSKTMRLAAHKKKTLTKVNIASNNLKVKTPSKKRRAKNIAA